MPEEKFNKINTESGLFLCAQCVPWKRGNKEGEQRSDSKLIKKLCRRKPDHSRGSVGRTISGCSALLEPEADRVIRRSVARERDLQGRGTFIGAGSPTPGSCNTEHHFSHDSFLPWNQAKNGMSSQPPPGGAAAKKKENRFKNSKKQQQQKYHSIVGVSQHHSKQTYALGASSHYKYDIFE